MPRVSGTARCVQAAKRSEMCHMSALTVIAQQKASTEVPETEQVELDACQQPFIAPFTAGRPDMLPPPAAELTRVVSVFAIMTTSGTLSYVMTFLIDELHDEVSAQAKLAPRRLSATTASAS